MKFDTILSDNLSTNDASARIHRQHDVSRVVGLESWTWTRVRFLEDLDLDSKVKNLDLKGEDLELGL